MKLDAIEYSEFAGEDRSWHLHDTVLGGITLVVGKNASGKTRFLNVVAGLAKLLTGEIKELFLSGSYTASFSDAGKRYIYELELKDKKVIKERLACDGNTLLERGPDGVGRILAVKLNQEIDFQAAQEVLAAQSRRDSVQHPFFEEIFRWAQDLRHYQFGTLMGRNSVLLLSQAMEVTVAASQDDIEQEELLKAYIRAFERHGSSFDQSVLVDLATLGYDCIDVGVTSDNTGIIQGPRIATMYVKERDLPASTSQVVMSQGMFRALSLVIQLNICVFSGRPRTILIDDVGEGLDFSRAQAVVGLVIEKASKHNLQVIMTSNDRFVMNGVPLQYWSVISRTAGEVKVFNSHNSEETFEEFGHLGLSNFDFFSTGFYKEGLAADEEARDIR